MLEIADDRIGKEMFQKSRSRLSVHSTHRMRVDTRRTTGAALVGQNHPEMLDGLGDPTVGIGIQRTRTASARSALQKHQQRQIVMHVLRCDDDTVEQFDRLAIEAMSGLMPGPIKRHIDGMILDIQSRHVILGQQRHDNQPFHLCRIHGGHRTYVS